MVAARSPGLLVNRIPLDFRYIVQAAGGSPEFSGHPHVHMPRSQTPAGTANLAMSVDGLLSSVAFIRRLSASRRTPILLPATIHISGFSDVACALIFLLLRTPPFRNRTSGRFPVWWLAFDRTGLACFGRRTRWLTLADFGDSSPSLRPELRSAREWVG